jgi:hypothetical protein
MNYWRALSYVGYIIRISGAVMAYLADKDEKQLAHELSGAIYEAVDSGLQGKVSKKVDKAKVDVAAQALATVIKDVV